MREEVFSPKFIKVNHLCRIFSALLLIILIFGSSPAPAQTKPPYGKDKLLEALRNNAKEKELSAEAFVNYIVERGVDFEMTPSDEVRFRVAGATSEVIAAIRNNYRRDTRPVLPPKSLMISTTPGNCQVFLNGQLRGSTNESGILTLRNMKAGSYKLTLRKTNYRDVEKTITVLPSGTLEMEQLVPLPAKLNATANTNGAKFSIRNVGQYSEKIENLELSPGEYDIEIAKPGYRAVSRHIVLAPGATFILPVSLEKLNIDEMMSTALQHLGSANFREAISLFNAILAEQPNNTQANKGLALAYYNSRNYEQSVPYFFKALSLGDKIVFKVKHRDKPVLLCSGAITLSKATFAFRSSDGFREGHDFEIPFSKFKEFILVDDIFGVHLHTKGRIPKPAGKKGEDEKDNNFYVSDTKYPSYERCPECANQLRVILELVKQLSGTGVSQSDDGSPGRPTLSRRLPTDVVAGIDPTVIFAGREKSEIRGSNLIRYKFTVTNHAMFADDLFAPSPNLPPCGANTKASRTWVDIFSVSGKRLYGFCAFTSSQDLANVWFALKEEESPPAEVFIVLTDRYANKQFKSNLAAIR